VGDGVAREPCAATSAHWPNMPESYPAPGPEGVLLLAVKETALTRSQPMISAASDHSCWVTDSLGDRRSSAPSGAYQLASLKRRRALLTRGRSIANGRISVVGSARI
jgi:hypothetical protein